MPSDTGSAQNTKPLQFTVNGDQIEVIEPTATLLGVLREQLRLTSVKDGCSPQGQCGCCTVLVDGAPRVSCVTPARRVSGREITTVEGLPADVAESWGAAFCATGGSQCGFCTPGIVLRFEAMRREGVSAEDRLKIDRALMAHLCRCTGWNSIVEAYGAYGTVSPADRDLAAAAERARIEGGVAQMVETAVALGAGGFADDLAPADALVAVPAEADSWATGETLLAAREAAGKIQGRRTTTEHPHPIPVPDGDWAATLQTSWVEPGYLETDASWCAPGGEPASLLGNGGAFGGKVDSSLGAIARRLADEAGRPVRVLLSREDTVRHGPKRPPLAGGVDADGTGRVVVARTAGIADAIHAVAPGIEVVEVDVAGPPTSTHLRAAGWAEAVALLAAARGQTAPVVSPNGARAAAEVTDDGINVTVRCGRPLDDVVLRSYCVGAAHMAYSWVTSESLTVDEEGEIHDLTIRSFEIVRAAEMPPVTVEIEPSDDEPINGSDAVFAAVAAATWLQRGRGPTWPTG